MARIAGVNIPIEKAIYISLQYIYGIGKYTAIKICKNPGLNTSMKVKDLSGEDIIRIREYIEAYLKVEGDLKRIVSSSIKRLIDIGCNRGVRHRLKLPLRGQRTHTNAKTRKRVS